MVFVPDGKPVRRLQICPAGMSTQATAPSSRAHSIDPTALTWCERGGCSPILWNA